MLYRGDSVNKSGININEPDDEKFFGAISNYYRTKGLNERANSSDKFFRKTTQPEPKKFVPYKYTQFVPKFNFKQGGMLKYQEGGSTIINQSPIFSSWLYNMLNRDNIAFQKKQLELQNKQLEQQEAQQQTDLISSIMGTAANGLLSLLNKKQATPSE